MYTITGNLDSLEGVKIDAITKFFNTVSDRVLTPAIPLYQKYEIYKKQQQARKNKERALQQRIALENRLRKFQSQNRQPIVASNVFGVHNISDYIPYIAVGGVIAVLLKMRRK